MTLNSGPPFGLSPECRPFHSPVEPSLSGLRLNTWNRLPGMSHWPFCADSRLLQVLRDAGETVPSGISTMTRVVCGMNCFWG